MAHLNTFLIGHCRRPISVTNSLSDGRASRPPRLNVLFFPGAADEPQAVQAFLAKAFFATFGAGSLADAYAFAAGRTKQQDVGRVDRHFLGKPAALLVAAAGLHVAVDAVDAFDHDFAGIGQDAEDAARRRSVIAGDDLHGVVFA